MSGRYTSKMVKAREESVTFLVVPIQELPMEHKSSFLGIQNTSLI